MMHRALSNQTAPSTYPQYKFDSTIEHQYSYISRAAEQLVRGAMESLVQLSRARADVHEDDGLTRVTTAEPRALRCAHARER